MKFAIEMASGRWDTYTQAYTQQGDVSLFLFFLNMAKNVLGQENHHALNPKTSYKFYSCKMCFSLILQNPLESTIFNYLNLPNFIWPKI